jgi:hypothetical protein
MLTTDPSTDSAIADKEAISLMRALESIHPRNIERASSSEAFIKDVSLLFNCSEERAHRLAPFVVETVRAATQKAILSNPKRGR